ncbi:MAG: ABC transporter substrate-binding protein, partial [Turicibacter sp.]
MKKSLLGWMMATAIIATGCSQNETEIKEPEALEPVIVEVEEKVETPQEQVSINILVPHGSTAMALSHMNFERPGLLPNV